MLLWFEVVFFLFVFLMFTWFFFFFFFFSSRRRHTRWNCDWSSDVCSSDLGGEAADVRPRSRAGILGPPDGAGDRRADARQELRVPFAPEGSGGQRRVSDRKSVV